MTKTKNEKLEKTVNEANFMVEIPITPPDIIQFMKIYNDEKQKNDRTLPEANADQLMEMLAVSAAFIQMLIMVKSKGKFLIDFQDKASKKPSTIIGA